MFQRLWRRLVKIDATPEQVAGGFATGVFTGITPTMGLGALIAAGFAALFRWNLAASVAGNIVGLPPILFGVWAASAALGAWLFGLSYAEAHLAFKSGTVWSSGMQYVWAYIVGNAILAAVSVPLSYWVVLRALQRHRAKTSRGRIGRRS